MRDIAWTDMVRALLDSGMLQKDIAERIGCGRATVSRWANGTAVPDVRYHEAFVDLFEENATILDRKLVAEIQSTDELAVLLDSRSRLVAISPGLRKLMNSIGVGHWTTTLSSNGLLRTVKITRNPENGTGQAFKAPDKP